MANTTISALSNTVAVADLTSNDFIAVDNAVAGSTRKLAVQDLKRLTLTSMGTGESFIKDISASALRSRSIAAGSSKVTVTNNSDTLEVDVAEAQIDLSNCNNTSSAFLSSVNATTNITAGTLPVTRGGTGVGTLTDKSILATQLSGADTLRELTMSTNGQLIIGGVSGPQVATLTAGSNISITNSDGGVTINNTFTTPSTFIQTNDAATLGSLAINNGNIAFSRPTDGIIHSGRVDVTQTTSLSTGVTCNSTCGIITLFSTTIAADTTRSFTVTNSTVQQDSLILVSSQTESTTAADLGIHFKVGTINNGSFTINITQTANQIAGSVVRKIHFKVINNS
jgi:hypothetical protein